jgi:hypothetical protein
LRTISVEIGKSFFNDLNISSIFMLSEKNFDRKLLKYYLRLWHVSAPRKLKDEKAIKTTRDNKLRPGRQKERN